MAFDAYTAVVSNFNGANNAQSYTAETGQSFTFVGGAKLSTTQAKFGASSLYVDGAADWVTLPDSTDYNFGTGDFTVELWVYFTSAPGDQAVFFCKGNALTQYTHFFGIETTKLKWQSYDAGSYRGRFTCNSNWTPTLNQWYHLAFIRNGSTPYITIDGVSQALTVNDAFGTITQGTMAAYYGGDGINSRWYVTGYIDTIRISKGIARWTSFPFTPPTAEYTADTGGYMTTNKGWM
jgi:hypothetical protein